MCNKNEVASKVTSMENGRLFLFKIVTGSNYFHHRSFNFFTVGFYAYKLDQKMNCITVLRTKNVQLSSESRQILISSSQVY